MKQIIGGNWKMNGTAEGTVRFMDEMKALGSADAQADIVVFPPFTLISIASKHSDGTGISIGGQDLFWEESGAYTGEISPSMLRSAGAEWFLAGHSERRHVVGETDEIVRRKLEAGLGSGLNGILCVGELIEEREAGRTEEVVRTQVISGIDGLDSASPLNLVIAYEPVWAIGTGLTATPEEAERIHHLIRSWVSDNRGDTFSTEIRIQYGGSVKPSNALSILAMPDINGALVGGASLKADSFMGIVNPLP